MFKPLVLLGLLLILLFAVIFGKKIEAEQLEDEVEGMKPYIPSEDVGIFGTKRVDVEEILARGASDVSLEADISPEVEKALDEGQELLFVGETEQAVETLLLALADEPNSPDLLLALGEAYENLELYAEALEVYIRANNLVSDDVSVLTKLADINEFLGNKEEALRLFRQIYSINPDIAEAEDGIFRLEQEVLPD